MSGPLGDSATGTGGLSLPPFALPPSGLGLPSSLPGSQLLCLQIQAWSYSSPASRRGRLVYGGPWEPPSTPWSRGSSPPATQALRGLADEWPHSSLFLGGSRGGPLLPCPCTLPGPCRPGLPRRACEAIFVNGVGHCVGVQGPDPTAPPTKTAGERCRPPNCPPPELRTLLPL